VFDWEEYPVDFKEKWYDYIDNEFNKREKGFWFYNKGLATYITGTHFMYLQWSKIDVGQPDFRESNRLFFIFWEACKADPRSYGMCYLKNRRSGFSFMSSAEAVNNATITSDARFGILSKSGPDAKKMFTDKVVPISVNYPFFFKPIQDGMDRPKTELAYRVPATKYTRRKLENNESLRELVARVFPVDSCVKPVKFSERLIIFKLSSCVFCRWNSVSEFGFWPVHTVLDWFEKERVVD
jgi:hypothetical protein